MSKEREELPNQIAFDSDKYKTEEAFWKDIVSVIQVLLRQEYIVVFKEEDCGVYIIEFDYSDEAYGTPLPYWMTPDKYERLCYLDEADEEEDDDPKEYGVANAKGAADEY